MFKNSNIDSKSCKKGEVVAIPLSQELWALGQVIESGLSIFVGVTDRRYAAIPAKEAIAGLKLGLASWTNAAEIENGFWKCLGQMQLQEHGSLPNYIIGSGTEMMVEDFDGTVLRRYDQENDPYIDYRTIRSPKSFEKAVRAFTGVDPWKKLYNSMLTRA